MASLTAKDRKNWHAQLMLSEEIWRKMIPPTDEFVSQYKSNRAHWPHLAFDDQGHVTSEDWPYDAVTGNFTYAHHKATRSLVLAREPKIFVRPSTRLGVNVAQANVQGGDAKELAVRMQLGAALAQIIINWACREFGWKKVVDDLYFDVAHRDIGICQVGYRPDLARRDGRRGDAELEMVPHKHMRPGWPFVVHQDLRMYRWDALATKPEEREWAAYATMWREEDLRAVARQDEYMNIPDGLKITHIAGIDLNFEATGRSLKDLDRYKETLGRVQTWDIWDRRTKRVITWCAGYAGGGMEIGVRPWPLKLDGLPDVFVSNNMAPDEISPVPQPRILSPLQKSINDLISLVMVYAKRGVPIIGIRAGAITEEQRELINEAEILEQIETLTDPEAAIKMMNLNPNMAHLLQALATVLQMHREISGQSGFSMGTRENVESAAEANRIGQGADVRNIDRQTTIEHAFGEIATLWWQVFLQSPGMGRDIVLQVARASDLPVLLTLDPMLLNLELDFQIQVGSTRPFSDQQARTDALAVTEALMRPEFQPHRSDRALADALVTAFDFDPIQFLASEDAAMNQRMVNSLEEMMMGQPQGGGGGNGNRAGTAAALAAVRSNQTAAEQGAGR